MKSLVKRIEGLLEKHPTLRDTDSTSTIREILLEEGVNITTALTITKFFKLAATIDRSWRLVQKNKPELRGTDWNERQILKEEKAKEVIEINNEYRH